MEFLIRKAEISDLEQLTAIYNYEVTHGVATLDLEEKSVEERKAWFYDHNTENHPLYVAAAGDQIAGYVSLSSYREKEAYRSTAELSIYIAPDCRRMGIATKLMEFILEEARRDPGIHTVVSVITSGNEASARLHERFGFVFSGTIKEVGYKFGRYLDIDNYYLFV